MLERKIKIKGVYRHFKGNYYFIEDIGFGSEDDKEYVIYRALYGNGKLYIRPMDMFLSKVDKEKYPDVAQEYRFELIENGLLEK